MLGLRSHLLSADETDMIVDFVFPPLAEQGLERSRRDDDEVGAAA